jgi:uncharacterized protein (TIGR03066 family)
MTSRTLAVLFVAAMTLFTVGCAAKPQDLIIGKWETPPDAHGKKKIGEFNKDGTMSLGITDNLKLTGKYQFVADNKVDLETNFLGMTKVTHFTVAVTRDTLTYTDEQGTTTILTRVKQ